MLPFSGRPPYRCKPGQHKDFASLSGRGYANDSSSGCVMWVEVRGQLLVLFIRHLDRVSTAIMKHHDQKQLEEKRVFGGWLDRSLGKLTPHPWQ